VKKRLRLTVQPQALHGVVFDRAGEQARPPIAFGSPEELEAAIVAATSTSGLHGRSPAIEVVIGSGLLQQRTLTDVPPVPTRMMREMIARSASRYFRQNGHALVTGAEWVQEEDRGQVVAAMAVDSLVIQAVLAGARQAHTRVASIVPEHAPTISLLPREEVASRRRRQWIATGWLAAGMACLWLLAIGVTAGGRWREAHEIDRELRRLQGPRESLMRARSAMDSADGLVRTLRSARVERHIVARALAEVSRSLPDSSVIDELLVSSDSGRIRGRSVRPGGVLKALERANQLDSIALINLTAPAFSANGIGLGEFEISFRRREP
jgi:hypothetical protein